MIRLRNIISMLALIFCFNVVAYAGNEQLPEKSYTMKSNQPDTNEAKVVSWGLWPCISMCLNSHYTVRKDKISVYSVDTAGTKSRFPESVRVLGSGVLINDQRAIETYADFEIKVGLDKVVLNVATYNYRMITKVSIDSYNAKEDKVSYTVGTRWKG